MNNLVNDFENDLDILILEDNQQNCRLYDAILTHYEYSYKIINCGKKALDIILNQVQPKLILLDLALPGLDGFKVFDTLKSDPAVASIPIAIISALSDKDSLKKIENLSYDEWLQKPIRIDALEAILTKYICPQEISTHGK